MEIDGTRPHPPTAARAQIDVAICVGTWPPPRQARRRADRVLALRSASKRGLHRDKLGGGPSGSGVAICVETWPPPRQARRRADRVLALRSASKRGLHRDKLGGGRMWVKLRPAAWNYNGHSARPVLDTAGRRARMVADREATCRNTARIPTHRSRFNREDKVVVSWLQSCLCGPVGACVPTTESPWSECSKSMKQVKTPLQVRHCDAG